MVEMKKLMTIVLGLMCAVGMAGMAIAGNIDSPGPPSSGSGMYTLQNLYDYLTSGTALTVPGSFQEPGAGPGSTMKSTKQIGDDVKALFVQCDATAANVESGKKFFSTVSGNWGVKTGTGLMQPTPTATPTITPIPTPTPKPETVWIGSLEVPMWLDQAGCNFGTQVAGISGRATWADGLVFAGKTDWRMPTETELCRIRQGRAALGSYDHNWIASSSLNGGNVWNHDLACDARPGYNDCWPVNGQDCNGLNPGAAPFSVRAVRP